jgi:UDP-N-acetylmuramoyl-tripeptide--D-alanyl-D-alanine ligase
MPSFAPDALESWTGGRWSGRPPAPLAGFSVDSRRLSAGQAFVALKTDKRDGHDFIAAARAAGAAAALVSRADSGAGLPQLVVADPLAALQAIAREHRRLFQGTVAGITGSAGKTSTKELLALLLGGEGAGVLATEANLNNQIGVALTLCRLDSGQHRHAVVEAGISAPGEMEILARMIEPDLAVVTLIGPAHLADLGSVEAVAREKAVLAQHLRPGGLSLYPSSCERFEAFRRLAPASALVLERAAASGAEGPNRVRFSAVHAGAFTTVEVAYGPPPPVSATLGRVTDGMAQNTALAICAALRMGVQRDDVRRRLLSRRPAPLRGEWRVSEGRRLYLDCYNANPASMADALIAFADLAPADEPRLFVLGCMEELGAEAPEYHAELGRSIRLRPQDRLIAVGSLAGSIRRGALEAGANAAQVEITDSIEPVAAQASGFRGSVFVKGSRRHELERAFAATELEASHA